MTTSFYVLRYLAEISQTYPQKVAVVLDDQSWTYSELIEQIERVACHLHRLNIAQGQIIYQFVDRSFEMICGLFGIMYAGGVYCSLNPTDPSERLLSILKQMQGQYVLLHEKTRKQFPATNVVRHIILLENILYPLSSFEDIDDLPDCIEYGAAYIICTSGTTGQQKAVVHTLKSLATCILALVKWDLGLYTSSNQVLQIAASSWALHLSEIVLPLVVGGTLVLLRPNGHLDMAYFCQTLIHQQVTTLTITPGIIRVLTNYLEISQRLETFKYVRHVCATGEAIKMKQLTKLFGILQLFNIQICTQYGMSECNTALGCQLINFDDNYVPIGYPMYGYRCLLIDEHDQVICNTKVPSKIGQIHIGGSSLLNCYLNDLERTANMFVTIDKKIYIKTGDLARYNARGELVHAGRIDFQIKMHGQRVETSEIENTIMNWSSSKISNCLVTKSPQNDNLLIAYIISNDLELDTKEIRNYCNKHLRQYMVPSYIIVLEKFPLNANGKVDRKQLPLPSLRCDMPTNCVQSMSELEEKVHNLWCSTLEYNVIPRSMSCFELGGSSLSLMQMFNYYQCNLALDKQLNVIDFFTKPTIAEHVQLLEDSQTKINTVWSPLHLVQGRASYAQESVWLAEQTRFIQQTPSVCAYNVNNYYRIDSGHLSIKQCLQAIDLVVTRHMIFHTRFIFNVEYGYLQQSIIEDTPSGRRPYQVCLSTVKNEQELRILGFQEALMSLGDGVFRCHFVRYNHTNEDILKQDDVIIFTFHHGSFDSIAVGLFSKEFTLAYSGIYNLQEPCLQYIDYATYERANMDMDAAKDYWREILRDYSWNRQLDLPYDYGVPTDARRSGRCWSVVSHVPSEITNAMINQAKEHNVSLIQLTLTCFYIFLAQLSPNNQDSCVTIPIKNRYRPELENVIGPFVNMLPCRMVFDASPTSTMTFVDLLHEVRNNMINMIKYGNMSYLELLELHRVPSLNLQLPFLHVYFALITSTDYDYLDQHQLNLSSPLSNQDNCSLSRYKEPTCCKDENIFTSPNMFDIDITFYVDTVKKTMEFEWVYSIDLFTYTTINVLSKQLISLLDDLFVSLPLQQLDTTPLVKLISMAKKPINLKINNQHKQLDQTIKVLTPLEAHIKAIYSRVLDTQQIDVNKSFFQQGGTSLKALQAIHFMQKNSMTAMVDANLFFANLSVTRLAQTIEASH